MSYYGDVVAHTRDVREFTQSQLAEIAGVTRQTVAVIKNGSHDVKMSSLESVLDALALRLSIAPRSLRPAPHTGQSEYEMIARAFAEKVNAVEGDRFDAIC